jgi:methylglutamate dehydrogenase subunit B
MRITCPYCGERSLDEFVHHGDASVVRPDLNDANAAAAFHAYGYERANVAGSHRELWYHSAGCHAWLHVARDTRTHEITDVQYARDVALGRTSNVQGSGL